MPCLKRGYVITCITGSGAHLVDVLFQFPKFLLNKSLGMRFFPACNLDDSEGWNLGSMFYFFTSYLHGVSLVFTAFKGQIVMVMTGKSSWASAYPHEELLVQNGTTFFSHHRSWSSASFDTIFWVLPLAQWKDNPPWNKQQVYIWKMDGWSFGGVVYFQVQICYCTYFRRG